MNDAIIGGAIAAVMGAVFYFVAGLWQERRREKAQKLAIIDALVLETLENLTLCKTFEQRKMWWTTSFKLEAYDAYKHQPFPLPEELYAKLVATALNMKDLNASFAALQQVMLVERHLPKDTSAPSTKELTEVLQYIGKELRKWRKEHTHSLGFRIPRTLQNLVSKIHNNSKLNH